MEDTIASTLSDALTWIATTTATAVEEWPTDQGDVPVIGSPAGDMTGPDDSEGSYFLVSYRWTRRKRRIRTSSRWTFRQVLFYGLDHLRKPVHTPFP